MVISLRGVKGTATTKLRNDLAQEEHPHHRRPQQPRPQDLRGYAPRDMLGDASGSPRSRLRRQSVVEVAREIVALIEKNPEIELKGAVLDGTVFKGKAGVTELSKFPTKDEAIGQVVTLVVSPAKKLLGQIKGPASNVGGMIKAIETKLEKGEAIGEGCLSRGRFAECLLVCVSPRERNAVRP
jgi:hypothetical protein